MTEDLVTWLRAQLDEDERIAKAPRGVGRWSAYIEGGDDGWAFEDASGKGAEAIVGDEALAKHVVNWDPARVLAEVEAKRRILDEHQLRQWEADNCSRCCDEDMQEFWDSETETETVEYESRPLPFPCQTVRLLALPYADQPGYREEWRP